jgi:superfamily II DNA or RNA helicase
MSFDLLADLLPPPDYYEVPGVRPYQREILQAIDAGWQEENCHRQLVVAATGTGKTVLMGALAKTFVRSDQRVLMLAHTEELLGQARDKFSRLTGVEAGLEKAQHRALLTDMVVVGSVQTLRGGERLTGWPKDHFGLIMIDEAHRTMAKSYMQVLAHFENARVVGVTATADRGDKQALGRFYERIAKEYGMLEAINDGWLVRVEIQPISVKIDLNGVGTKRNTDGDSDLDLKVVSHRIEPYLDDIAAEIWTHAKHRRILGFTPSIDIAKKMVEVSKKAGFVRVEWVAGEDKERTEKIAAYKRGDIQLLWNAMLLTEGFDQDDIDALAILRPTDVRALYQQMCGRGTRPLASILPALNAAGSATERRAIIAASPKPHVLVLDPLWLHETHDLAQAASLVSKNPDEMALMKGKQGDLLNIAADASRDLMDSLREKILKNANRRVARIDPFTFGVVLGHEELALYQPETLWDARPPTIEQLRAMVENGIEADAVKWRGQAQRILTVIDERKDRGLCSIRLMNWLRRHNIDAALMTHEQATKHQRRLFATGFR